MEELEREEISREDIITYVDMLLEKHRFSYNRRLAPLLYEFFLRSAKTFNWSKDEFLDKYINFNNIVKKIKFKKLAEGTLGLHSYKDKSIYISEDFITELKKNNEDVYNQLIDTFYHECLHATDFEFRYGKEGKDGLKEIENGYEKNLKGDTNIDMMLNEYGNIISSALISSNTGLYEKNVSIWPKLSSYQSLWIPGTVFCTAFDISEKTIAELKDKGRVEFDKYFKEKYPYLKTDVIIEGFRDNLSIIHNAVTKKDKENIILGHLNIIELGNEIINQRILHEFTNERNEEFVQRMYFNLHKIYVLINNTATEYKIDKSHFANVKEQWNNLYRLWNFYKKFKDNEKTMSEAGRDTILENIRKNNRLDVKTLVDEIGEKEYEKMIEYDVQEIADKYYLDLSKPLNDNTELIKYLQKTFVRPTLKERLEDFKNKFKRTETLPMLAPQANISEKCKDNNFKENIQTETLTGTIKYKKIEKQQEKEEGER